MYRIVQLLCATLFLFHTLVLAENDSSLSGRIFNSDKRHPLMEIDVRIVQLQTGKSLQTRTDSSGCYQLNNLAPGIYTLSSRVDNVDYSLIGKILLKPSAQLAACAAIREDGNVLTLVKNKCICDQMPEKIVILGTSAASGLFLSEADNMEDAAAYRP